MKHTLKFAKITVAGVMLLMFSIKSKAQHGSEDAPGKNRFAIGLNLSDVQGSFGYGLNITSPHFLNNSVAVRAAANFHWLQHPDSSLTETTWTPFTVYKLGLSGGTHAPGKVMRFYGEGGAILIIPNKIFSGKSAVWGGYGLFGFEFVVTKHLNYFLEFGGSGAGATADKVPGKPIYFNGFMSNVGLRVAI